MCYFFFRLKDNTSKVPFGVWDEGAISDQQRNAGEVVINNDTLVVSVHVLPDFLEFQSHSVQLKLVYFLVYGWNIRNFRPRRFRNRIASFNRRRMRLSRYARGCISTVSRHQVLCYVKREFERSPNSFSDTLFTCKKFETVWNLLWSKTFMAWHFLSKK